MISRLRENTRRKRVREVNPNYWTRYWRQVHRRTYCLHSRTRMQMALMWARSQVGAIDRVARVADDLGSR